MYEDFYLNKNMFDFSEYPNNSRFYDVKNKKITGKIKDETKEIEISDVLIHKKSIRGKR